MHPTMAVCIPTYNRSLIVRDFLEKCSRVYIQAGIDIYFYDSSDNQDTENIIAGWPQQEGIYYIRMPSQYHPNRKVFCIFQEFGLEKAYDFIFLSADAIFYSEETINVIMERLSLQYDIISLECSNEGGKEDRLFTDPDQYLHECIYHMASFGKVILNAHTMLHNVDWEWAERQFLTPNLISWSHVGFYFHRITELNRFTAYDIALPQKCKFSEHKKASCWWDNYLFIMGEGWVGIIEQLPDCYTNKIDAIREYGGRDIPDLSRFFLLRRFHMAPLKEVIRLRSGLKKLTHLSYGKMLFASLIPVCLVDWAFGVKKKWEIMRLRNFCRRFPRIMIYGAGDNGKLYAQFLEKKGISFEAFCVSRRRSGMDSFCERPLYAFSELASAYADIGFVLGMTPENAAEVLNTIKHKVKQENIFYNRFLHEEIRYEEGYGPPV